MHYFVSNCSFWDYLKKNSFSHLQIMLNIHTLLAHNNLSLSKKLIIYRLVWKRSLNFFWIIEFEFKGSSASIPQFVWNTASSLKRKTYVPLFKQFSVRKWQVSPHAKACTLHGQQQKCKFRHEWAFSHFNTLLCMTNFFGATTCTSYWCYAYA